MFEKIRQQFGERDRRRSQSQIKKVDISEMFAMVAFEQLDNQ